MPVIVDRPPSPRTVARLVLLGSPVTHSLSPVFQNAALAAAGRAERYEAIDVAPEALDRVLDALIAERAAGNVTVPHKERVAMRCDWLTPTAAAVRAVNCWWVSDEGALVGDNTDVGGFDRAAHALLGEAPPARVALLGAGGSAAAVAHAVSGWTGVELALWARTPARAEALAARTPGARACATIEDALVGATLVVNATPLGLHPDDPFPVDPAAVPAGAAVLDLVYAGGRTPWIRALRAAGRRADDGLAMLIEQGALAFTRWLGVEPDRMAMWRAVGGDARAR